ncbi:unnamed protein product [Lampetra fluviatilis]
MDWRDSCYAHLWGEQLRIHGARAPERRWRERLGVDGESGKARQQERLRVNSVDSCTSTERELYVDRERAAEHRRRQWLCQVAGRAASRRQEGLHVDGEIAVARRRREND